MNSMPRAGRLRCILRPLSGACLLLAGCMVRPNAAVVRPAGLPPPAAAAVRTSTVSGVVVSAEPVLIDPERPGVRIGDVLGSLGNARRAAGTIERATATPAAIRGEEITVRLEDGQEYTVVQERRGLPFEAGERIVLVRRTSENTELNSAEVIRPGDPVAGYPMSQPAPAAARSGAPAPGGALRF